MFEVRTMATKVDPYTGRKMGVVTSLALPYRFQTLAMALEVASQFPGRNVVRDVELDLFVKVSSNGKLYHSPLAA